MAINQVPQAYAALVGNKDASTLTRDEVVGAYIKAKKYPARIPDTEPISSLGTEEKAARIARAKAAAEARKAGLGPIADEHETINRDYQRAGALKYAATHFEVIGKDAASVLSPDERQAVFDRFEHDEPALLKALTAPMTSPEGVVVEGLERSLALEYIFSENVSPYALAATLRRATAANNREAADIVANAAASRLCAPNTKLDDVRPLVQCLKEGLVTCYDINTSLTGRLWPSDGLPWAPPRSDTAPMKRTHFTDLDYLVPELIKMRPEGFTQLLTRIDSHAALDAAALELMHSGAPLLTSAPTLARAVVATKDPELRARTLAVLENGVVEAAETYRAHVASGDKPLNLRELTALLAASDQILAGFAHAAELGDPDHDVQARVHGWVNHLVLKPESFDVPADYQFTKSDMTTRFEVEVLKSSANALAAARAFTSVGASNKALAIAGNLLQTVAMAEEDISVAHHRQMAEALGIMRVNGVLVPAVEHYLDRFEHLAETMSDSQREAWKLLVREASKHLGVEPGSVQDYYLNRNARS